MTHWHQMKLFKLPLSRHFSAYHVWFYYLVFFIIKLKTNEINMMFLSMVSIWIIPVIIFIILLIATWKKVPTYELFVEGGKEGIDISLSILPFLLGMLVSIAILQSSGALTAFVDLFTPFLSLLGIPADIVPLAIVKPISGTASLGMMTELTKTYAPHSF